MLQRHSSLQQVGAQDPELPNSPIAQEEDEDTDVVRQQLPGVPVCLFNGREFRERLVRDERHGTAEVQLRRLDRIGLGRPAQSLSVRTAPAVTRPGRSRPGPSARLPTSSVPPCASTISRHSVSPRPLPAGFVE